MRQNWIWILIIVVAFVIGVAGGLAIDSWGEGLCNADCEELYRQNLAACAEIPSEDVIGGLACDYNTQALRAECIMACRGWL